MPVRCGAGPFDGKTVVASRASSTIYTFRGVRESFSEGAEQGLKAPHITKERNSMHAPIKYFEKGLSIAANGAWVVFDRVNQIKQTPSFIPAWSDKPLLKSYQKTKPPLGWPRDTDSLCP